MWLQTPDKKRSMHYKMMQYNTINYHIKIDYIIGPDKV